MRKIILFLVFCVLPFSFYGQNSYLITDSLHTINCKIIDSGDNLNSQYITVETDNGIINYTPEKVKEYGFDDGRVYVSKSIFIAGAKSKVFLLRLVKGKLTLYEYKGKEFTAFYWETDSTSFFELPKYHKDRHDINFRNDLEYITSDCKNVSSEIKMVSYTANSLSEFVRNYNECKLKPLASFRYGIILGFGLNKLENPATHLNTASNINFNYHGDFLPGLFFDYPIPMSDFSIHTDFYFTKNGYSYNKNYTDNDMFNKNTSFVANITSINIPVLIRYTLPTIHARPFLNAGIIYTFNIKNSTGLYTSTIYPTYIESSEINTTPQISKNQLGYSAGGGFEIKLNNTHSFFIELRYNKLYCIPNEYMINKSEFQLITGLNI
jgi:opacity protein-like surface antigen